MDVSYLSAWVTPTTVNDLFQALITPRRDPTRRGSASQPELRRETRPGSWLSRIQSGKSWLSPHWNLVEIMYFMDFPLYQTYIVHIILLYVFVDCKIDMLNLVLFEVSFASRTSKESNESHVRPAKCKTGAPKHGCLENPKWCLTYGPLNLKFGQQAFFFFKAGPFTIIIYHQNENDLLSIAMWEFSKMMDPKKMSTLGFRDPFVAILLGKRSIFGTYASTARRHCWTPPRHKLSERSLRWGWSSEFHW